VLVVGNDTETCVRTDSRQTELHDPATGEWSRGPRLNKGRAAFAAVTLADGRALIAGGINPDLESYSSSYVFDPVDAGAGWTRSGLLLTGRTAPACAVLADDRVLVAGGFFQAGPPEVEETAPGEMGAIPETEALATAELFDPVTGKWSKTGRLRMARSGAAAVGLADGRALVVGSFGDSGAWAFGSNVYGHVEAFLSSEVFDPATGRFALAGELPPLDWAPVLALDRATDPDVNDEEPAVGSLVALPGGDAMLFGRTSHWYAGRGWEGVTVRTLRFRAADGSWRTIDQQLAACDGLAAHPAGCDEVRPWTEVVGGRARMDVSAATLQDGKVLVAGGIDPVTGRPTTAAELYDPEADRWIDLPPLPEPRAGAAAVVLDDGSVLIVGGYADDRSDCECDCGETGLASAVRFVPEP
jgi:hypothetical protein